MTPRKRSRPGPGFRQGQLLDWTTPGHWAWTEQPCRWCGQPTPLRDSGRHPSHKVCAEQALATQAAEALDAYQIGQLTP